MKIKIHDMKKLLLLTSLALVFKTVTAQNLYASIGKETPMLTLSEGIYQEFIPNDTIIEIGTVLFNRVTNEVVRFIGPQEKVERTKKDVSSRFLSIDPIGRKYPELTPYQFASDNPIWGKDINGLELITPFFSTSAIEILPDLIQSDITLEQGWITHPTTIPIFYNESQQTPLSPYKAAESSNPKPEPLLKRENRNNKNKRDDETFELYITIRDNKQTKGTTNQPLVYIGHKLIAKGYRRYGTEEIQEKNYEPILQGSYDAVTGAEQLLIELNNRGRTDNLKTSVLLDNDKNAIDPKRKPTQYLERTLKGRLLLEINNPKWRTDYKRSPKVIREKLKPTRA